MKVLGSTQRSFWRKIALALWLVLWPLLFALHWYPIRFASLRLCLVVGVVLLWAGALGLFWNKKPLRWVCLAVALVAICTLLPGRAEDPLALRRDYGRALLSYEGTPYVWGGESRRGIDCSGLLRCALIDANVRRGLATFNPALLHQGFSLWWHDCSARALKDGYRNQTRLLFTAPSLNRVDHARLEPGDMAVTSNGVHVLAYLGDKTWIEADPNALHGNSVIRVLLPSRIAWFEMPVHLLRWRQLEP